MKVDKNLFVMDLIRAQERLRQAEVLTRSAGGLLAELSIDGNGEPLIADREVFLTLKAITKLTTEAGAACENAVHRIGAQIAKAPL